MVNQNLILLVLQIITLLFLGVFCITPISKITAKCWNQTIYPFLEQTQNSPLSSNKFRYVFKQLKLFTRLVRLKNIFELNFQKVPHKKANNLINATF